MAARTPRPRSPRRRARWRSPRPRGDAAANDILQRGAAALARAATVVAVSLALPGGPVYLAGGAFESLPLLQKLVRLELLGVLPQASVEPVREEPAMGAARMAMELAWPSR